MTAPARALPPVPAAAAPVVDPAALLTLVQWLSPAFPTGAFAWSGGMETAIAEGRLPNAAAAEAWIADLIDWGLPQADAILLAHALRPGADHAALADLARALAPTAERLRETEEQGAAFARAVAAAQETPADAAVAAALPLPVALGRAAAPLALPAPLVLALFLQALAGTLVSVAVRFVPLGQSEGQRILARLRPAILRSAEAAAAAPLSAIATATLGADIASARHETLAVRMFRS